MSNIRAKFDERVVVHTDTLPWVESPIVGVNRKPIERVGQEVARATSIVRYAPGSKFPTHRHMGGEEFIVLSGVFQDEYGDFPAGSYVRNPPQSAHSPQSRNGCVIFVKLWQMQSNDRYHSHIILDELSLTKSNDMFTKEYNVSEALLYKDEFETVKLLKLPVDIPFKVKAAGGIELFVLKGEMREKADTLRQHSWLRLPPGEILDGINKKSETIVWIKTGNVINAPNQIKRVENASIDIKS